MWQFYWSAYRGGPTFCAANITKHPKEDQDIYLERVKRAYYLNYVKSLMGLVVDYVFANPIPRERKDDPLLVDVDRKGTPVDAFMRDCALRACVKGMHYVLVDEPMPNEMVESRADERRMGIRPYWCHYDRECVLNWELDERGEPIWVLVEDHSPASEDFVSTLKARKRSKQRFKLWTRNQWLCIEAETQQNNLAGLSKAKVVDDGANRLGIVPIVAQYGEKLCDWDGESLICDVAYVAKALLNICSLRDDYNYQTAIEQLVFCGDGDAIKDMFKSSRHVLAVDPNSLGEKGFQPYSLACTGTAATILKEQIADHISEIHRLMQQRLLNTSANADGASGESKREDFKSTNTTLAGIADECERVENALHAMVSFYAGGASLEAARESANTAGYPDDFDVSAVERDIRNAIDVATLDAPDSLRAALLKKVARKLLADSDDADEVQSIIDDIDEHFAEPPPTNPDDANQFNRQNMVDNDDSVLTDSQANNQDKFTPTPAVNGGQRNSTR